MGMLSGETVLVTGAAQGIGEAIATRFLEQGARVALLDRNERAGRATADRLGCAFFAADAGEPVQCAAAVGAAAEALGGCSILVNNAGASTPLIRLHEFSLAQIQAAVANNLFSYIYATHAALPLMLGAGRGIIVNIASESALSPPVGESIYGAAKAGAVCLTRSIAVEYGPAIRCNCISPGIVHTPMSDFLVRGEGLLDPVRLENPGWEPGTAANIADIALFLASPMAAYVNGQNIVADGGTGLHHAGWTPVNLRLRAMFDAAASKTIKGA